MNTLQDVKKEQEVIKKKNTYKLINVFNTFEKSNLIKFIYENKDRFCFYLIEILNKFYLCALDELYQNTEIIGIVDTKKEIEKFDLYFIQPSILTICFDIDDNGLIKINPNGEDSIDIEKNNWGLRLIARENE